MSRGNADKTSGRSGGGGSVSNMGVRSVNFATSPLLASQTPPWRSRFVVLLVGLAFVVLLGRAVHLQVLATDFYQAKGDEKFLHKEVLAASRGRILDRNGLLLAASVALPTLEADTKTFEPDANKRRALAKLLGLSAAELDQRVDNASGTIVLRRHIEEPLWQQIKALKLKGVSERREFKRRYPEGEAAAHIVGLTTVKDTGLAGAELAFDAELMGEAGARTVVRDRLGRVVEDVGEARQPDHGNDVMLSIDSRIQSFAWQKLRDTVREHGASAGSVVALDIRTGEVLALANYPGFDPDSRDRSGAKLRNIAVTDTFEPGSTMKPFIAALALESGRFTPASMVETAPGHITITGATIRDSHVHGTLSLAQVIQKSSNVGTVKLAQQLPMRDMWALYSDVGMGQKPRIDFPGVAHGRLRPYKTWRPIEHATMSYGYGLSASLFQLARAYSGFARDGDVVPATLLRHDPSLGEVVPGHRVMSPETARQVREMLRLAANPGGTAPQAQERTLGYSVGGKTGTARMHGKGGYTNKHRSFFVGLAPISNPRVVVAVMVAEPSKGKFYGGDVAAPLFGQVMQQTLRLMNVTPDMDVKAQINAKPAVPEVESY